MFWPKDHEGTSIKKECHDQNGQENIHPQIKFSEWNPGSKEAYIYSAERNMDELQKELSNKCSKINTLMAVNGTVLGLILAFMINSKIFDNGGPEWLGYTLIAGFCIIFASFALTVWHRAKAESLW